MNESDTPFLAEVYHPESFSSLLAKADKTPEQFEAEIRATVRAFCAEHRGKIKGCVIDTYRETIGICYGMETMDLELSDPISDQEWDLFQNGWENISIFLGPGTTEEEVKDFSTFALKSHYTND